MLKYLIIGTGGTGGVLGAYLAQAGKDVTFIARGEHLKAMQEKGLQVIRVHDTLQLDHVKACTLEDYHDHPDVIFVCVKGYSIEGLLPKIKEIAPTDTVIIPILNIYGTGAMMQQQLPGYYVTDGCIYVASQKKAPGVILMSGDILRVVFGPRRDQVSHPLLPDIKKDLDESGIMGILSDFIERDALKKFSYVSPQGACGLYYNIPAGPMQKDGVYRDTFAALVDEIRQLAKAQDIDIGEDIVAKNLDILDHLAPDMTTSLQKDIAAHHASEIDGLIHHVVKQAQALHVSLPTYEKISAYLKNQA
jgi:2-dehydropantoate 2-reductase